jgi:putative hydrolase of the HAD superfamily
MLLSVPNLSVVMHRRIISFDLDGTLINWDFAEALWFRGMSEEYAKRWGLDLREAMDEVKRRYDAVGMERLEWYDIEYWWREFDLPGSWRELAERCRHAVGTYPEVHEVLGWLRERCDEMIVVTNGCRELSEIELEQSGIGRYVDRLFSVTSDFRTVKKDGSVYRRILAAIGASPDEVVHVGDNWIFDYLAPREAGIRAFFLDREGRSSGDGVVGDLREFANAVASELFRDGEDASGAAFRRDEPAGD